MNPLGQSGRTPRTRISPSPGLYLHPTQDNTKRGKHVPDMRVSSGIHNHDPSFRASGRIAFQPSSS